MTRSPVARTLEGKVAVVTGASRGLGRHLSLALAAEGVHVAAIARGADGLRETEREVCGAGGAVASFVTDVGDADAVGAVAREIVTRLGPPAILVNAAGAFGPIALVAETDPEVWVETLRVNTVGPYLLCRAFVGGMIGAGWGRIVNVSSAGSLGPPGPANSAYGTSKAALNHLTRHLAAELDGTGVTANVIHPGELKTEMWAEIRDAAARLGPEGEGYRRWARLVEETGGDSPEQAVALVLRLLRDEAAGVNGQFLWIENGLQAPRESW